MLKTQSLTTASLQDHYALLGCKNLGYPTYKVPVELIHLAFRKQTMWNHPDKKSRGDWTDEDREVCPD